MKYYDKLIFEISRPGRVGYSLPKNWSTDNGQQSTDKPDGSLSIVNCQFLKSCFARHLPSSPK